MNTGRHVEFCSDGILRVGRSGTMVPALSLCGEEPVRGIPWWMAALPVSIQEGTRFRNMLRCLSPWRVSIAEGMGVDLSEWDTALRPMKNTPNLVILMEVHSDLAEGDRWNAFVRGTCDEDFGNPDEIPFDILGASEAKLSRKRLLLSSEDAGRLPLIDAGHPEVFLTWPWGNRKSVGVWSDASPPGFSDFVCNCLLGICLRHITPTRTAMRMLESNLS